MDIYTDMWEYQVTEERDPDLNEDQDFIMDELRDKHWRYVDLGK